MIPGLKKFDSYPCSWLPPWVPPLRSPSVVFPKAKLAAGQVFTIYRDGAQVLDFHAPHQSGRKPVRCRGHGRGGAVERKCFGKMGMKSSENSWNQLKSVKMSQVGDETLDEFNQGWRIEPVEDIRWACRPTRINWCGFGCLEIWTHIESLLLIMKSSLSHAPIVINCGTTCVLFRGQFDQSKKRIKILISGISRVSTLTTGVITYLLSGMNHRVQMVVFFMSAAQFACQKS